MQLLPGLLAEDLPKEIPEVEAATRFRPWFTEMLVSYDSIHIKLDDVVYTDASFLQMFDFPLKEGNRKTALSEPSTAVITESTAKKYFKNNDPIGKTLVTLNNIPVKITAVAKDVPFNSSLQFTMLISWGTVAANKDYFFWMNNWETNVNYSFVQLKQNSNVSKIGNEISAIQHQHRDEKEFSYRIFLQSLDGIHLHSSGILYAEQFHTNSSKIVYTLLTIAALILLIACFNFINLTTAGALGRAKESGVQKVLGASQFQLIKKFFGESFILCFISLSIAVLVIIALPLFNHLANSNLEPDIASSRSCCAVRRAASSRATSFISTRVSSGAREDQRRCGGRRRRVIFKPGGSLTALPSSNAGRRRLGVHPDERHLDHRRPNLPRVRPLLRRRPPGDQRRHLGVARRRLGAGESDELGRRTPRLDLAQFASSRPSRRSRRTWTRRRAASSTAASERSRC